MKNRIKISALAALAVIGSTVLAARAYGQYDPVPTDCVIFADVVGVNFASARGGDDQIFTSSGNMHLDPGALSGPDEPVEWMELVNGSFSATSSDPALGEITWELDNDHPATSIIRSNQAGATFPATVELAFSVRATINGLVYLSRTPIRIGNSDISSWPPGDTHLNLVDSDGDGEPDPVEFYLETNPDETVFTVTTLSSTVRD